MAKRDDLDDSDSSADPSESKLPEQKQRNWWRWSTIALAVVTLWQCSTAGTAESAAKKGNEQADFYRVQLNQICRDLTYCSNANCKEECDRTNVCP